MSDEPCGEFKEGHREGQCHNCGWPEHDHKGPKELKREWMEATEPKPRKCRKCGHGLVDGKCPRCAILTNEKEPMARLVEVVERQQKLVLSLADMVVGMVREEYAKNLLSLEQVGQLPELVEVNKVLLAKMTEILTEKSLLEQPALRKMPRRAVAKGIEEGIKRSVEEYIKGMPDAPR